jgi:excisionase family DNA binding protein
MEPLMTSEDVAGLLHVDPVTSRRLVTKGELSAYRIGSDYRFAPADLAEYLQRQRIVASSASGSGSRSSHPFDEFARVLRTLLPGKQTTPSQLMGRFDLFTPHARHVLTLAQEEAQHLQHTYIGTEHLLLGLLREREDVASQVLSQLGIDVERVRAAVISITGRGEQAVHGEVGMTPRAKLVFELALEEARGLGHDYIGTEHILLGLIREGHGIAAGVLEHCGIQLSHVRTETLRVLLSKPPAPDESADLPPVPAEAAGLLVAEDAVLVCATCGARCPRYFRWCFHCGHPLGHAAASPKGEEEDHSR